MSTTEDVFALYERNKNWYCLCNDTVNNRKTKLCSQYCYLSSPVQPLTIGDQDVPCSFARKIYIRPGEECSICLDGVLTKSSAYLSPCGHSFHKECIFKAYETKMLMKYGSQFRCPCCRGNIGAPEILERYDNSLYNQATDYMDLLETFWLHKNTRMPILCTNKYNHPIGLNTECNKCLEYRETGNFD
jgi:hypothetical protein